MNNASKKGSKGFEFKGKRELTCKTAFEFVFEFLMGRETEEGFVASAYSAKSIETSPMAPAFDDPYKNTNPTKQNYNLKISHTMTQLIKTWK